MVVILHPHRDFATAYLDDVIIHSSTWADHLHHLKSILGELRKPWLTTNPQKCHLRLTEAQYLGYRISQGLLNPQAKKIETVLPPAHHQVPGTCLLGVIWLLLT